LRSRALRRWVRPSVGRAVGACGAVPPGWGRSHCPRQ
jgi:hypothetical protein